LKKAENRRHCSSVEHLPSKCKTLSSIPKEVKTQKEKPHMVVHICNPSAEKTGRRISKGY
jgi:hypothetical protein